MNQSTDTELEDILLSLVHEISSMRVGKTFNPMNYINPAITALRQREERLCNKALILFTQEKKKYALSILPEKKLTMDDAMWDFPDGMEGQLQRADLVRNQGWNDCADQARATIEGEK